MAGMSKKIHRQKIQLKTEADVCSRGIGVEGGLMEFRMKTLFKGKKYIKSGKLGLFRKKSDSSSILRGNDT